MTGLKFDQQKKQVDRRLNADRVAEEKQKEQRIKKNRRQRNTENEEVVCTGQDFAEDARGTQKLTVTVFKQIDFLKSQFCQYQKICPAKSVTFSKEPLKNFYERRRHL